MTVMPLIPEVVVDPDGGHKFIVVKLTDQQGAFELVIRGDKRKKFHSEILADLRKQSAPFGLQAQCIGGGYIDVDPHAKSIKIWGTSTAFGKEPDRDQTASILQSAFRDYQVLEKQNHLRQPIA